MNKLHNCVSCITLILMMNLIKASDLHASENDLGITAGETEQVKIATLRSLEALHVNVSGKDISARISRKYEQDILIKLVADKHAIPGIRVLTIHYPNGNETYELSVSKSTATE